MAHTVSVTAPSGAKAWLPEDEAKLLDMRAAGESWAVIAKALGRTQASVQSRAGAIQRRVKATLKP